MGSSRKKQLQIRGAKQEGYGMDVGIKDQESGSRRFVWLPVTRMLDGSLLRIPVHVVKGSRPGPTMTLVSTLHGGEFHSIDVIMEVIQRVDPGRLTGNILAIPVANPPAFAMMTRDTPGGSDVADMNRVFPGGGGWLTMQMARAISESVLPETDYAIDYHPASWGAAMENVSFGCDFSDPEVVRKGREMAIAYGVYTIREMLDVTGFPGPRSIGAYAGEILKVPTLGVCTGGSGFDRKAEDRWLDINVGGTLSVLRHLGMYEDADDRRRDEYLFLGGRGLVINPQNGGMLCPLVGPEDMNRTTKAGSLLARVVDPYTFDVLEEMVLPEDGVLFGVPRHYPVRPGEWAFFAALLSSPDTRVVRP